MTSILLNHWLWKARLSMTGEDVDSSLSSKIDCFSLLTLPPEIIDNITARLDFQSLQVLRCCCKKLGEWTNPLLFGTLRVRFRLRDLTSLQFIAAHDRLRHFVHTLVYIGDQYCDLPTFSRWKGALGIIDRSPTPAHYRPTPAEPPPWTLEHAQWRGYRRYQQVRKEQKNLQKQHFDDSVLLEAIPQFSHLKHVFFLMQQGDWRVHSQSASIRRIMQDWKPSSDMYHHWGATKPTPQLQRHALTYQKALEWLSTPSQNPISLESLVISGYSGANDTLEPAFDLSTMGRYLFSSLRHLTLDFRIRNASSLHPWDATWLCSAIRHIVTSSQHVETLDVFSPNLPAKLGLELLTIFDLSVPYTNLKEVCLSFVTFDDKQLHSFLDHLKDSIQRLTIERAVFSHATSWKDYVLSDTDGRPLVEKHEPSRGELIDYWLGTWETPEVPRERRRETAEDFHSDRTDEILASFRESWFSREHDELFHLEWPENHVLAGGKGIYKCTTGVATVTVEWPQNRSG